MRCLNCDKFLGVTFNAAPVLEGFVCPQCFEALGFDKKRKKDYKHVSFEKIKNGYDAYLKDLFFDSVIEEIKTDPPVKLAHYGEKRELDATDGEFAIFSMLQELAPSEALEFARKSNDYVCAMIGPRDFARFKFTDRARWIIFPIAEVGAKKHYIDLPEDIRSMSDLADKSLEIIRRFPV